MASVTVDPRNGNVRVKVYAGIDPDDPRRRKRYLNETLPPDASEAEIARACDRLEARAAHMKETGLSLTLDDLVEWYLDALEAEQRPPGTVKTYRCWYSRHIAPRRGKLPAEDVRPFMIRRDLADAVAGVERGPISASTANGARAVLHAAYAAAMAEGLVQANPVSQVRKLPAEDSDDARAFDESELAVLDGWIGGEPAGWDDLCARSAAALALASGLRVGEVCALRPSDIGRGSLRVAGSVTEAGGTHRKGTKSGRKRSVSIDSDSARAAAAFLERRAEMGFGPDSLAFCAADGRPRAPSTISSAFSAACSELGLGDRRFHELRHTHATILLEQGVSVKVVSERLGHASEAFTLRTYGHVLPGRDRAAADGFGQAMRGINPGGGSNG